MQKVDVDAHLINIIVNFHTSNNQFPQKKFCFFFSNSKEISYKNTKAEMYLFNA